MNPAKVEPLGNDLARWRIEVARRIRRGDTLDERELIQALNWWLFGPRHDEVTGEWGKATHRSGSCGVEMSHRVSADRALVGEQTISGFGGVETCASPWACPHCAAKIRAERALEVGEIIRRHLGDGGHALFLTLTRQNLRGESAVVAFGDAMAAWDKLVRSRPWKRLMDWLGRSGFIRATEVTHSLRVSWHPHHHVALLVDRELTEAEVERVRGVIAAKWAEICGKQGRNVNEQAGVTVVPVRDAAGIGWYVSKIELELSRGDLKRGYGANRSPWQIAVEAAVHGDKRDMALWVEYVEATRGRRSTSYSKGLLARFGLREESDEEKAERAVDRQTVAFIPSEMYREVRKRRGLAELRRILEGDGGADELAEAVERCLGRAVGVEVGRDDRPKDDDGPSVPSLVFLEPTVEPVLVVERLEPRDVRATIRVWAADRKAERVAGCRARAVWQGRLGQNGVALW